MKPKVYLGLLPDMGAEETFVIADSPENAKLALLRAWKDYNKTFGSDYQVKTFEDLAEIYGACVIEMPWNEARNQSQLEPI